MSESRFTETQIVAVRQRRNAGAKAVAVCPSSRAKYGGLEARDLRRLRELEDENRQLKTIVADQVLNIEALTSVPRETSRTCSLPGSPSRP
jgi:putative transposase